MLKLMCVLFFSINLLYAKSHEGEPFFVFLEPNELQKQMNNEGNINAIVSYVQDDIGFQKFRKCFHLNNDFSMSSQSKCHDIDKNYLNLKSISQAMNNLQHNSISTEIVLTLLTYGFVLFRSNHLVHHFQKSTSGFKKFRWLGSWMGKSAAFMVASTSDQALSNLLEYARLYSNPWISFEPTLKSCYQDENTKHTLKNINESLDFCYVIDSYAQFEKNIKKIKTNTFTYYVEIKPENSLVCKDCEYIKSNTSFPKMPSIIFPIWLRGMH